MKKKNIIAAAVIGSIMLVNASAYAQESMSGISVNYNRLTGVVESVRGNTEEASVSLIVLKPGADLKKLDSGTESFNDWGIYADETNGGEFTFDSFKLSETLPAGDYTLLVSDGKNVCSEYIYHATIAETLELISNESDVTKIEEYIKKYNDAYNLPIEAGTMFAKLNNKQIVFKNLCGKTFASVDSLQKEFKTQTVLTKVYEGPWGELEGIITDANSYLGINLSSFTALASQINKNAVMKAIVGKQYFTATQLESAISGAVAAINNPGVVGGGTGGAGGGGGGGGTTAKGDFVEPSAVTLPANNAAVTVGFEDLEQCSWAKEGINALKQKGIISGRTEKLFEPMNPVTRSEAVKMAVMAFFDVDEAARTDFSDVSEDNWAYRYISTAQKEGIVTGMSDGTFGVEGSITREDFVAILYRAFERLGRVEKIYSSTKFADDADISDYAAEAVGYFKAKSVIRGSDNKFMPKNNITRAEVAVILWNCIK